MPVLGNRIGSLKGPDDEEGNATQDEDARDGDRYWGIGPFKFHNSTV